MILRAALAAALVVSAAAPARAYCRTTTDPDAEPCGELDRTTDPPERYVEWRRPRFPVALAYGDRGPPVSQDLSDEEVSEALVRAFAAWSDVRCGDGSPRVEVEIFDEVLPDRVAGYDDRRDDNVGTVFFLSPEAWERTDHEAGSVAITTVWFRPRTGEALDADMEINDGQGPFVACRDAGCPDDEAAFDLRNILTHEAGHALGFAHSDDAGATMFGQAERGETLKRDLAADDEAAMCAVYGGYGCRVGASSPRGPGLFGVLLALMVVARVTRRGR